MDFLDFFYLNMVLTNTQIKTIYFTTTYVSTLLVVLWLYMILYSLQNICIMTLEWHLSLVQKLSKAFTILKFTKKLHNRIWIHNLWEVNVKCSHVFVNTCTYFWPVACLWNYGLNCCWEHEKKRSRQGCCGRTGHYYDLTDWWSYMMLMVWFWNRCNIKHKSVMVMHKSASESKQVHVRTVAGLHSILRSIL